MHYTVQELSQYFGVSADTICRWIEEERFIGIQKITPVAESILINQNVMWRAETGELILVADVVRMWHEEHGHRPEINTDDELAVLHNEIDFFEKKYGGRFAETLKLQEQLTDFERQDSEEWQYLLARYKNTEDSLK